MKATLEPIAWVLRLHPDPDAILGAPYTASATVHRVSHETAAIAGLTTQHPMTKAGTAAIIAALAEVGIETILYERRNAGRQRHVTVKGTTCTSQ